MRKFRPAPMRNSNWASSEGTAGPASRAGGWGNHDGGIGYRMSREGGSTPPGCYQKLTGGDRGPISRGVRTRSCQTSPLNHLYTRCRLARKNQGAAPLFYKGGFRAIKGGVLPLDRRPLYPHAIAWVTYRKMGKCDQKHIDKSFYRLLLFAGFNRGYDGCSRIQNEQRRMFR